MNFEEDKKILDPQIQSKIKNIEIRINALNEEAKAKLAAGDNAGAKRALAKKKKFEEQIKQLENAK